MYYSGVPSKSGGSPSLIQECTSSLHTPSLPRASVPCGYPLWRVCHAVSESVYVPRLHLTTAWILSGRQSKAVLFVRHIYCIYICGNVYCTYVNRYTVYSVLVSWGCWVRFYIFIYGLDESTGLSLWLGKWSDLSFVGWTGTGWRRLCTWVYRGCHPTLLPPVILHAGRTLLCQHSAVYLSPPQWQCAPGEFSVARIMTNPSCL